MNRSNVTLGIVTAAFVLAPLSAFAQGAGQTQTVTTTTTTQTTQVQMDDYSSSSHSIVSGSFGGAFGGDTEDGSFGFDGSYDYLHNAAYGFEFLGTFTPDLDLNTAGAVTVGDTQVNSYMFNAIGAIPLGLDANWLPFVSGGVGVITLRNDLDLGLDDDLLLIDDNQFGGNIGFGLMGFYNQIGLRADVRYFRGFDADDSPDVLDVDALNDLTDNVSYWRSTVGVSFRW